MAATSEENRMRLTKLDLKQLVNSLEKQADIVRRTGAEALADALDKRARSLEPVLIPVEPNRRTARARRRD